MENTRILVFRTGFLVFLIIAVSFPSFSLAYGDDTTHPALTQEIIEFYNSKYSSSYFSPSEAELIIQGSIDEDVGNRFFNHFYDPVHNRGLTLPVVGAWPTSKEWGTNTEEQRGWAEGTTKDYFSGPQDFSWDRAVYEYVWGDKNHALLALGGVIHLLEDLTVPDHTRNDPHPPVLEYGSPYEAWTKQFVRSNIEIQGLEGKSPVSFPSIGDYFDSLARYSNTNFFSKDSISSGLYSSPILNTEEKPVKEGAEKFLYRSNSSGERYRLVSVKGQIGERDLDYFIEDKNNLVLSDYWRLLSRQAVLHGAGVLKLFRDEVEKEKQTETLKKKNTSLLSRIWSETSNFIFGTTPASPASINLALVGPLPVFGPAEVANIVTATKAPVVPVVQTVKPVAQVPNPITVVPKVVQKEPASLVQAEFVSEDVSEESTPLSGGGIPSRSAAPETSLDVPFLALNEIAWAGTGGSGEDEWVELYNPGSRPIDLSGFVVFSETKSTPYIPLSGSISPGGYYLIESDELAISNISADLVASFGEGISDSGEKLVLGYFSEGATTTIDSVFMCSDWCEKGGGEEELSLERYDALVSGNDVSNWDSNTEIITYGLDRNGERTHGTPRERNSVTHLINKNNDISGAVTLTKAGSPYTVNRILEIGQDGVLRAESGAVIKFTSGAGFLVSGQIVSVGDAQDPVVFTSINDDSYGGDTLGDGEALAPFPSDWGISFFDAASTTSQFEKTIVRYSAGILLDNSSATFLDTTVSYAQNGLLLFNQSSVALSNVAFKESASDVILLFDASRLSASNLSIEDADTSAMLLFGGSTAELDNASIREIGESGIALFDGSSFRGVNVNIRDVGRDGFLLFGDSHADLSAVEIADVGGSAILLFENSELDGNSVAVHSTGEEGIMLFDSTHMVLSGLSLRDTAGAGTRVFNSSFLIDRADITNTPVAIETYRDPGFGEGETLEIIQSSIAGNGFGIRVYPDTFIPEAIAVTPVIARNVWWGDPSGPLHATLNPDSLGDEVSEYVEFVPHLSGSPF